jgi:uncharacterized membrane protein
MIDETVTVRTLPNLLAFASAAVLVISAMGSGAFAGPAIDPGADFEKCFGVAKAGRNDCQTATHSCAGMSKQNGDGASWLYVPKGTCTKLVGASLTTRK